MSEAQNLKQAQKNKTMTQWWVPDYIQAVAEVILCHYLCELACLQQHLAGFLKMRANLVVVAVALTTIPPTEWRTAMAPRLISSVGTVLASISRLRSACPNAGPTACPKMGVTPDSPAINSRFFLTPRHLIG
jgi:ABC-type transport system involved in cytochrome bd biosynthesis fused ATPase/permease subunit